MRSRSEKKVEIRTIPSLAVWVDGNELVLSGKREELKKAGIENIIL